MESLRARATHFLRPLVTGLSGAWFALIALFALLVMWAPTVEAPGPEPVVEHLDRCDPALVQPECMRRLPYPLTRLPTPEAFAQARAADLLPKVTMESCVFGLPCVGRAAMPDTGWAVYVTDPKVHLEHEADQPWSTWRPRPLLDRGLPTDAEIFAAIPTGLTPLQHERAVAVALETQRTIDARAAAQAHWIQEVTANEIEMRRQVLVPHWKEAQRTADAEHRAWEARVDRSERAAAVLDWSLVLGLVLGGIGLTLVAAWTFTAPLEIRATPHVLYVGTREIPLHDVHDWTDEGIVRTDGSRVSLEAYRFDRVERTALVSWVRHGSRTPRESRPEALAAIGRIVGEV